VYVFVGVFVVCSLILYLVFLSDFEYPWEIISYRNSLREFQFNCTDANCEAFGVPTYFINLDRSYKRRGDMVERFRGLTNLTRIPAVDGLNLTDVENVVLLREGETVEEYATRTQARMGEVALTMSHFRAIKTAYDAGHEYALVLEDDASTELVPFGRCR